MRDDDIDIITTAFGRWCKDTRTQIQDTKTRVRGVHSAYGTDILHTIWRIRVSNIGNSGGFSLHFKNVPTQVFTKWFARSKLY